MDGEYSLEYIDKKIISDFFNDNGNVMDLTNYTFSELTKSVINKDLKIDGLSKGKSLNEFIMHDGTDSEIVDLSKALLEYYHDVYVPVDPFYLSTPDKVEEVVKRYSTRLSVGKIRDTNYFDDNDNKIQNGKSFIINLRL